MKYAEVTLRVEVTRRDGLTPAWIREVIEKVLDQLDPTQVKAYVSEVKATKHPHEEET